LAEQAVWVGVIKSGFKSLKGPHGFRVSKQSYEPKVQLRLTILVRDQLELLADEVGGEQALDPVGRRNLYQLLDDAASVAIEGKAGCDVLN